MKTLTVFDQAMCCPTGVCGPEPDVALISFAADAAWLRKNGINIERFSLSGQPESFVTSPVAAEFLKNSGTSGLPLILLDGNFVMAGCYPTRSDLTRWFGISLSANPVNTNKNLCGGKSSCC